MPTYRSAAYVPALVQDALALAERMDFANSCLEEVGRLLRVLASNVRDGVIGEIGAGTGVAAAWMVGDLAPTARFVTVELDESRATAVQELLQSVPDARVIHGDWHAILEHGPFDLLFVDAAPAKAYPGEGANREMEHIVRAMRVGGLIVMDDLSPQEYWPEEWRGRPDPLRELWLNDARLAATEVLTTPRTTVILATRLA